MRSGNQTWWQAAGRLKVADWNSADRLDTRSMSKGNLVRYTRILVGYCLCSLFAINITAHAYEVQPMIQRVDLSGNNGYSSIQIRNTSDTALPVAISTYRLELEDGSPHPGPAADNELLAFPPSVLIPPLSTQAVRIQWLPETIADVDTSYIVLIEELPNLETREGVQMLLAFNAIIHVHIPGTKPALTVTESTIRFDETAPVLAVELHNTGDGNAYGHTIDLQLEWESGTRTVTAEELSGYASDLFLPPGYRRTIDIPVPGIDYNSTVEISVRSD